MSEQVPADQKLRAAKTRLINLAAQMVHGGMLASDIPDDHRWYRSTPIAERRLVLAEYAKAREQAKLWGIEARAIYDMLTEASK